MDKVTCFGTKLALVEGSIQEFLWTASPDVLHLDGLAG